MLQVSTETISQQLSDATKDQLKLALFAAIACSLVLPRLPYGRQVLYPFALLGTWAHELGHGVAAVLAGGRFERLEVYPNLGGTAYSKGVTGSFGRAFVSAGGLLGPALVGGVIIVAGAREETAKYVLVAVAGSVLVSVVLVLRNRFGFLAMGAVGLSLGAFALWGPELGQLILVQLIGIQFCFASWGTLDYMFTKEFHRDGYIISSDTENMAKELILPYWFWGGLVALLSGVILVASFYFAWVRPELAA